MTGPANRLWSGPLLAALFILVTLVLAPLIPGYSLVRDSVSGINGLSGPPRPPSQSA